MALRYGEEGGALEVEEQPPAEIVKIKWSKVKSLFVLSPICNNGKKERLKVQFTLNIINYQAG